MKFLNSLLARSLNTLLILSCVIGLSSNATAQQLTTIAGGLVGDGLPLQDASLSHSTAVRLDADGNLYIADQYNHRIRKVTPAGVISTVVGTGYSGFSGDGGQAAQATLYKPRGIAFDAAGNLYISDSGNNRIRKVTPAGVISTVAGDGSTAVLNVPENLVVASDGTIYVSEPASSRVRKIVAGVVSPFAGTGSAGSTGDGGAAIAAKLNFPKGLILEADGSVLIADMVNNRLRRVDTSGNISTFRTVSSPTEMARDSAGVLYVSSDYGVFKDTGASFQQFACAVECEWGFDGDGGPATQARLNYVTGIAIAADGRVFINDYNNQRLRVITNGVIDTYVGPGRMNDGGTALGARVHHPGGMAYDAAGNLYVSETDLNRIRKITPAGVITTFAGTGITGSTGDGGPAVNATLYQPRGLAFTASGDLLVADSFQGRIRKISPAGIITTLPAFFNTLPNQIAVAPNGDLYVTARNAVYKVSGGSATLFVGGGGMYQDNVPATMTMTGNPGQIAVDSAGNVYFADLNAHAVRKVGTDGIIRTVAGVLAVAGTGGDGGAATSANLTRPSALYLEANGNFVVGDGSGRLRRVTNGIIQTIAGTGTTGFNGDGAALSTQFENPGPIVRNSAGELIMADLLNNRVRKLPMSSAPAVSIGDVSIAEGNSGTKTATFTVNLTPAAATDVTFDIATAAGTATASSDYVSKSLTGQSIAAGQNSTTFTVTINGDTTVEPDETFFVNISNVSGAQLEDGQAQGTITNDDVAPVTLSVADATTVEGNEFSHTAGFWITLSAPLPNAITVTANTSNGTATAGQDYTALSSEQIVIPANTTSQLVNVWVFGDTTIEADETFNLTLSNAQGVVITDGQAVGTITNDDLPPPTISVSDSQVTETDAGNVQMTFNVSLSHATSVPVGFKVQTYDGTAVAGLDYNAFSWTGSIPAGESGISINVTVLPDNLVEGDELFNLRLENVTGAAVTDGEGVGTIRDDDQVVVGPTLNVENAFVTEGNLGTTSASVTFRLSEASASPVWFSYRSVDGTATSGSDYTAINNEFTIPAGSTTHVINIPIIGDTAVEPNETFAVELFSITGASKGSNGVVTIVDNDSGGGTLPLLSVNDVSVVEGNAGSKQATFTINLSAANATAVLVDVATANGTATAGSDYVAKSTSSLRIPPGTTSKNFVVVVNGDTTVETDENFLVNLSNARGATIIDAQAVGTIANDDNSGGSPTLSIADTSVSEGNGGTKLMTFTVSLSAAAAGAVTYDISTADGSAMGGSDYVASSLVGQSIPAGQTSKTFSVMINGDTTFEPDEFLTANIVNVSGATLADGQAEGTITNDDTAVAPTLSIADVSISEGNSGTKTATFTVSLSAAASTSVTYDITTTSGTAMAGSDYVSTSATGQVIPAGQTSRTFSVTISGDTTVESDETFSVTVMNITGATAADAVAVGTITNDDAVATPTISVSDGSLVEGNSGTSLMQFSVTLSAPSVNPITFDGATVEGTASAASDYVTQNWGLGFQPGETMFVLAVPIKGDTTVEPDETLTIVLSNVSGATFADAQATGTIINDDTAAGSTLSIGDVSIVEGNSGSKVATFTLTLSAPAATAVTYNIATAAGTATAPSDFVNKSQSNQSIAAGQTSKTFTVSVKGDTVTEADESFFVNVTNVAGATLADGQAIGTITNDDGVATPTLSIADVSISEGNSGTKTATFTVTLSAAASGAVTYDIATSNGTATAGTDYVASSLSGQSITAGQTSKTFSVTINGDTTVESDETFNVTVSNVAGATISDGSAIGTIGNDDAAAGSTLSIGDVSISEGNSGTKTATFTVTLSAAAAGAVTYDIATSNGTATAGTDYVASSLSGQSITAGQTSKTFAVTINGDTTVESDETFNVTVSNVAGATISDGSAIGTISNDDSSGGGPTLSIGDVTLAEGNALNTQFSFTVSLSAAASTAVTFNIATADGTAIAGTDYTAKSMTAQSIAAGQTSKIFIVQVKGDRAVEPNETFLVNVTSVTGATVGDGQAVGTITNDDAGLVSIARVATGGLFDDIDDGNRAPLLSHDDYALLLLDTAQAVCERAQAPTIVGIDGVENKAVLEELALSANALCTRKPKYAAVFNEGQGSHGLGFLVDIADDQRLEGVRVIDARNLGQDAKVSTLTVMATGHDQAMTVLLARETASTKPRQANELDRYLVARRKLDPEARLVVLGANGLSGLVDITARAAQADKQAKAPVVLPAERIFVSQSLLDGFKAEVALPRKNIDPQVLKLQP